MQRWPAGIVSCFDIDGALCTDTHGDYAAAEPFYDVIEEVNRLYADGHAIFLYTARGATTGIDWRQMTERQLSEWDVRYHKLFAGKPTADVYVDDRAITSHTWRDSKFNEKLPKPRGN